MRRIRITSRTGGRTCLALFRRDDDDPLLSQTRSLWNVYDHPGDWYDVYQGAEGGAPWMIASDWPYMFVFGNGLIGMARGVEINAALASVGLRLVET